MKTSALLSFLGFALVSASAYAGPCDPAYRMIEGEKAKAFITAIKAAGFEAPSTESNGQTVFHYRLGALNCHFTNGGVFDDGITVASCEALPNGIANNSATATLVANALSELGVFADSGMSKEYYDAKKVGCSATADESGVKYACVATAVWVDACQP